MSDEPDVPFSDEDRYEMHREMDQLLAQGVRDAIANPSHAPRRYSVEELITACLDDARLWRLQYEDPDGATRESWWLDRAEQLECLADFLRRLSENE